MSVRVSKWVSGQVEWMSGRVGKWANRRVGEWASGSVGKWVSN